MRKGKHRPSPAEDEEALYAAYKATRAERGMDDPKTWDAFFAWMEAALPWT